jgi:hypothetical protein
MEEADGGPWRLVDHIVEIKNGSDEKLQRAAEQILHLDEEIEKLLTENAGLYEAFPPPKSFVTFIEHSRRLRLAWEQGRDQTPEERLPFPVDLDNDILAAISAIRDRFECHGGDGYRGN